MLLRMWRNWKLCALLVVKKNSENTMTLPQKIKQNYYMIQHFPIQAYIQKKWKKGTEQYLYTHVHSSIFHNTQKVTATQVPINALGDKQNVVHTYNQILFKKEILTHVTTWINSEDLMLCDTKGQVLYDCT